MFTVLHLRSGAAGRNIFSEGDDSKGIQMFWQMGMWVAFQGELIYIYIYI